MTKKIIIDTDPGVDDALAIVLAFNSPELDVIGLTTVFGNVAVQRSTANALILSEFASYPVPVYEGQGAPMQRDTPHYPDFVHGADGFGNIDWPASDKQAESQNAVDFIIEQIRANPGQITIVALGPLTNLGRALEQAPDIAGLVEEVVIMGGAVHANGNVSPVAEANIIGDPHAADKVMTARWPLVMVGLDVTSQVLLSKDHTAAIAAANPTQGKLLHQACDFYIDYYRDELGIPGCMVHDPSTIAYLLDPSLFETLSGPIRVATDGLAMGQTIFAIAGRRYPYPGWENKPNQQVCFKVDKQRVLDLLVDRLSHPSNRD
ncbi:nucleoside hydrolase [Lacimicrobium alkaliphilum]|uniref:Nucleoside hydrolase n=1 Tax=Lacimicrobium alkaliphilum TaxID=1526571 RepID=A0ABQ1RCX0_9ALTE|nr:nucleoside hydrolase [Lacimicrobium alkaliphilum]GGD62511.1 nucleoside hydrolase [Lacimicrobium alkaliphilum]